MNGLKKALSVFLAVLMLCSVLPYAVIAKTITDSNGQVIEIEDGETDGTKIASDYAITPSDEIVKAGDEITFALTLNKPLKSSALAMDFLDCWDQNVFEFVSGKWLLTGAILTDVSRDGTAAAIAYTSSVEMSGDVFCLTLKVKSDAAPCKTTVSAKFSLGKDSVPALVQTLITVKGSQAKLSAPTMASHTTDSITLNAVSGAEYSMDGVTWQASPVFAGLKPATAYSFYQRLAETEFYFAGEASPVAEIETDSYPAYLEIVSLPTKLEYDRGEELDLNGLELLYHDVYGQTNTVDASKVSVSGYDKEKAGEMTVSLSYMDSQVQFNVKSYAKLVVSSVSAMSGETVEVFLTVENAPDFNSLAIENITFDSEKLEFVSAEWLNSGFILKDWNVADRLGAASLSGGNADLNGKIAKLTFRVADDAEDQSLSIDCDIVAKLAIVAGQSEAESVLFRVTAGEFEIKNYVPGDVDGVEGVSSADAIYLLYYTLLGDQRYPVNQNCDYNKDGVVTSADAIYLLYYTLLGGDRYPIA